jgi:hypothetical protein
MEKMNKYDKISIFLSSQGVLAGIIAGIIYLFQRLHEKKK